MSIRIFEVVIFVDTASAIIHMCVKTKIQYGFAIKDAIVIYVKF